MGSFFPVPHPFQLHASIHPQHGCVKANVLRGTLKNQAALLVFQCYHQPVPSPLWLQLVCRCEMD